MKLTITYILFVLCLGTLQLHAQSLQDIEKSYTDFAKSHPREKVFVHTDKEVYLAGELLWLKIYNTDAAENKPLDVSKVAYVEVLDKQQTPVIQAKIALKNSTGSGSLNIPLTLNDGTYTVRAYTNWMKNFSPELFFEKAITIVNPLNSAELAKDKAPIKYDVQFFPEGGNLINGVEAKVGFKITDSFGNGVDNARGAILDQRNDTIARFKPMMFGMGNFLLPVTSSYRAVVYVNGNTINTALPAVKETGYTMQVSALHSGEVQVQVSTTGVSDNEVYLLATNAATLKVAKASPLQRGKALFIVNRDVLSNGVNRITIFNAQKKPVCERLLFKRPQADLNITSKTDKPVYGQRAKVALDLLSQGQTPATSADLSVSVYQTDSLQKGPGIDIKSYLWLKSELKGNIQSPGYYFNNVTPQVDEALDNLLLTQGWRQLDETSTLPVLKFLPEFTGHVVRAMVTDSITGAPAKNVLAYLAMPGLRTQTYAAESDNNGELLFNTKDFIGNEELVIEPKPVKDSAYVIKLLSPFADRYSTAIPSAPFDFDNKKADALKKHSVEMQVQNIYAGNMLRQYFNPGVDSTAFYYKPYKTYNLDDYTRFTTMEEVLREYVRQTLVYRSRGHFAIHISSGESGILDDGPQLIMVDGVPVFNFDKIVAMDPLKVQKLDVIPMQYFYGPSNTQGVLNFKTYMGDMGGIELDPHALVVDYEGMQLERKFYSPVYDTPDKQSSTIPDYRNVLYWNANAGTDASGRNQLSFYTGDQPGKYVIVVQGITPDGTCGSSYSYFEVK
ncbi:hypothetical protein [Mucilaginibacter ginkgonis]|uniref:MG2 domain-containing protein n=1 Tax=Mucilaginibacter ginkgonis TaxID=2682091 RepID=A0A6I4HTL4_9SPHI|nr:hypothetical protein [Mucilaginibacter ginkgonis]QQL50448.1 hypothetical protein GO620_003045 [Mucilaginibacter ginkgonis]